MVAHVCNSDRISIYLKSKGKTSANELSCHRSMLILKQQKKQTAYKNYILVQSPKRNLEWYSNFSHTHAILS